MNESKASILIYKYGWEYILENMASMIRNDVEQWFDGVPHTRECFLSYYCYIYKITTGKTSFFEDEVSG